MAKMLYKTVINLPPVTKKNSQRVVHAGKRHIPMPSAAFERYEREAMWQLKTPEVPISQRVNVKALYYMQTRRRVDLTNLHEALHDVLVAAGVLADDNSRIVASTDGSRVLYDPDNPRTEIEIEIEEA